MKALRITVALVVGLLNAMGSQAADVTGGSIYTCVDAGGRKLNSDRPIAACTDRTQRELAPSGNTRRIVGPSLTEQERAEQAVLVRQQEQERERVAEDRRRERVLVARYPNQAAHDAERNAAVETADSLVELAQKRQIDLKEHRKALNQELEFYQRDPSKVPAKLRQQLQDNDADLQEQQRFILSQAQEKRRIHQRFDKELVQLRALWAARQTVPGVVSGMGAAPR